MIPSAAQQQRERSTSEAIKKLMSDAPNPNRNSPPSASGDRVGLHSVLEAEASRQRAATAAAGASAARATASATASRAAAGLPTGLGGSLHPSAFSRHEQMLAGIPPSLRASQSLDLAASIPPSLRPSQSLDLATNIPQNIRAANSLDLGPPALGRGTSLTSGPPALARGNSLSAAPPAMTRGAGLNVGPPSLTRGNSLGGAPSLELAAARRAAALGAGYPAMYDPRRRFLLAQQAAATGGFPGAAFGPNFLGAGAMAGGPWRNMPNEGVTGQGLELLRAASLSLPNRMGGGMPPPSASVAAAAAMGSPMGLGAAAAVASVKSPDFSPEAKEGASRKRKAKDDDSSDEEGDSDKVFIPEIRELDILCGRGGKSNHHFGNKRYRQVVSEMKMMYRSTEAKTVKTDLSRAIVDHVCSYGGRFVKKDDATGKYYLLTKAEARKKTSQALRETKALKWTM